MKKIAITNHITNRVYRSKWESDSEMQAWIDNCIAKNSWGKPAREISEEMINFEDKARALSSIIRDNNVKYYKVPADYTINIIDEMDDEIWYNELQRQRRSNEYPSWSEVMEALVENMEGRPGKLEEIKYKRSIVRDKYPKSQGVK